MRYGSWHILYCRDILWQFVRSCPFQTRPIFVPVASHNFDNGVMLSRVVCWMFIISRLNCFLPFAFQIQLCINFSNCLNCSTVQFPCNSLYWMWVLQWMPLPLIGFSILRAQGYLYPWVAPGQVLCAGLILPYRSVKPFPWCCIEWLFGYLARWLPCS